MKKGIIAIVCALMLISVNAAPVRKALTTYTQPDGSVITVRLCGDEYYHYYTTEDGTPITLCDDGYYRYTTINANNELVASSEIAGYGLPLNDESSKSIINRHKELHKSNKEKKQIKIQNRRAPMRHATTQATAEGGKIKGLIVLAEFQDKKFKTSQSTIYDMMNKEGYTDEYGSIGSARDYFIAQSYGQFQPEFDVVGPITLSEDLAYYGKNDSYGDDLLPDVMVTEACELASEQGLVDMSDYDLNGDGWVDLVYVIYAGYGENVGGVSSTAIWPHAWYIYQGAGRTVKIDGVQLDAYACSAELYGSGGSKPDGIGTFCHEYSHTLGLPDWYDIDYSGGMGMDMWSIMDQGCYAGDGYVPINYNAYEKAYCGWLELNELTHGTSVEMPELNKDKHAAYKVTSNDENQYITLETRCKNGWDKHLPAEGMMVIAIDYDERIWENNGPNNSPSRQRFTLIPADNRWNTTSLAGDLYPYNGNTSLTSTSTPKMKVYNNTINDKPITNIAYSNGVTTFDFMGGKTIDAPIATSAGQITENSFTAYWSRVKEATSYTLYVERIEEVATPAIAFEENFDKFTANSNTDVSAALSNYTQVGGWKGSKVFCNNGEVKLGSSSYSGYLTTPAFATDKEFTLTLAARSYNEKAQSGTLTIRIEGETEHIEEIEMSKLPAGSNQTITLACNNGGEEVKITIESSKRIYIDDLKVSNGIVENVVAGEAEIKAHADKQVSKAISITERLTIEGITDTYYTVTEVENEVSMGTYRYKVRAMSDIGNSVWSNVIEVEIDDASSVIDEVATDADIYSAHGTIYIKGYNGGMATVYNMQGVAIATMQLDENVSSYTPATAGIYIVRCGEEVTKVAVTR